MEGHHVQKKRGALVSKRTQSVNQKRVSLFPLSRARIAHPCSLKSPPKTSSYFHLPRYPICSRRRLSINRLPQVCSP
ncbi:hypothetical protein BC939DRAFT_445466 [Gamsiella multidivaricata]|uniref:uncharacterized protein n=1 Tax=Gamsiella multidivaricata TaxID=101098 RepID=UPI00221E56DC|nr:uncharacterized protein BC939DRAFT_445466 [Gamsiella multidivaricata]KAI7827517.1 hypothetical protein BC939DRAFT_445466 [Gamsiella multidivaricata]